MQYVRSISGSVSKTWNSINPATLSGAIDVIVIEQEDGLFVIDWVLIIYFTNFAVYRHPCVFTVPRPIRQVLVTPTIRKEGTRDP